MKFTKKSRTVNGELLHCGMGNSVCAICESNEYYSDNNGIWHKCPQCNILSDNDVITIGEVRKILGDMYDNLPDDDEELFKTVKHMSKEANKH